MTRKRDVTQIHLEITDIEFSDGAMTIYWSSDIGWGQYWIGVSEEGEWEADSECMDRGDDKDFLKELLRLASQYIAKKVLVVG